jgi:hypothetical protein
VSNYLGGFFYSIFSAVLDDSGDYADLVFSGDFDVGLLFVGAV